MADHLNHPETILLGTECLCCGIPLKDAQSVETGIGPVCRKRYGHPTKGSEGNRAQCNVLVHKACRIVMAGGCVSQVYAIAGKIEALGFEALAARVRKRFAGAYAQHLARQREIAEAKQRLHVLTGQYSRATRTRTPPKPYKPNGNADPFQPTDLNAQATRISEADRLHPSLEAAEAVDLEVRAGFAQWPDGAGLDRLLGVCRNLRACGVFSHLTDEHMRHLWRTRGEHESVSRH